MLKKMPEYCHLLNHYKNDKNSANKYVIKSKQKLISEVITLIGH